MDRTVGLVPTLLLLSLLVPDAAAGLERQRARALEETRDWESAATCSVLYYNYCTGWVWSWGGLAEGERLGVVFESCATGCELQATSIFVWPGPIGGYGYTGELRVETVDENDCPTGVLASTWWLPDSGWNHFTWGSVPVPDRFAVVTTNPGPGFPAWPVLTWYRTDHPAAGATGPPACGTCYPLPRATHSYSWGTPESALCPGEPFLTDASECTAELLFSVELSCPTSVRSDSWGGVKMLYR